MELVARKADLVRELQFFQQIVERKNTIPILANVLLETDGNTIRLLATDIEVTLSSRCEAAVDKPGSATLPAKKLYEIVRSLPDGDVRLASTKDGGHVTVSADRFESRMPTMPVADFPTPPASELANPTTLASASLRQLISKTQFAITGEDTRYYLNGALFVIKPDSMTMVATDGHRLAMAAAPRTGEKTDDLKVILPRKTLSELGRLLADSDRDVEYERGENHMFFRIGPRLLVSRMIDGQFPAYEKVIPKGNDKHIEFERDRLTSAVKRVAILSNERSRALKFQIEKNKVDVTTSSPEFGDAREPLTVDYAGNDMTICFNAQYVLDFLNVVETDVVSLDVKDDVSQAVLGPVAPEGYSYTYVIMPMRV
jgi:DNA polymerase III subunit beta